MSNSELEMNGKERSSSSSDLGEECKMELLGDVSKSKSPIELESCKSFKCLNSIFKLLCFLRYCKHA